jgi:hypothetical protein
MTFPSIETRFTPGQARTLIAAALLLLPAGCGKIGFDIDHKLPEQQVQGSPLGGILPLTVFEFPLMIDLESQTKAQGTGPAHSASLKSLELAVTSPSGETFDFLESITIGISAQGLEPRDVASLTPVPAQPRISLKTVPEVDLLPYIQKGATMKASASGNLPRQTVRFDGTVVIRIRI